MNDLISRQDAIDAVKIGALSAATIYGRTDEGSTSLHETVRAIKALPPAEPQWIPCSERLPDEDFWSGRGRQFSDHVLVTIVNHANDDEPFADMAQTIDGIWQLSHDVDGDCSLPNWCEVIAWMPLPEPYKEKDNEKA